MAKHIKLTPDLYEDVVNRFRQAMATSKFADGKISFSANVSTVERRATVKFTAEAYKKMWSLIDGFTTEVGWHGVAKRGDDASKDEYIISDVFVYPQMVDGANVNTDQNRYQTWLYSHENEVFNNLRFHGHSHVNMGTSPSSVDNNLYSEFLAQLTDDDFYIFMIWNKRKEKTIKIYDMKKNILFETADVTVEIETDDSDNIDFASMTAEELEACRKLIADRRTKKWTDEYVSEARTMVSNKTYRYETTPGGAVPTYNKYGGAYYQGYQNPYTGSYTGGASSTPSNTSNAASVSSGKSDKKRRGKRKDNKSARVNYSAYGTFDDDDDPYSMYD